MKQNTEILKFKDLPEKAKEEVRSQFRYNARGFVAEMGWEFGTPDWRKAIIRESEKEIRRSLFYFQGKICYSFKPEMIEPKPEGSFEISSERPLPKESDNPRMYWGWRIKSLLK